ncbi:MAG: THO complex subunit 2 [Marteilia pararefringens]
MILLSQIMDSAEYESTFSQFHDSLVQCIGIFNLDPIRVLELLLIVYKFSYGSHSQNLLLFRKNLLKFIAASGLKIHLISLITMRSGSDRILSQEDYRVLLDLCADKIVDFTDVSTIVSPQTKLSVSTSFSAYLKCLNGALKSLNVISLKKDDDGTGLKYSEAAKSHYELVQASGEFKLCLSGCDPLYQDFDKYSKFMLHIVFKSPRFAYTCCSMELINSLATHIVNRLKSLKVQDNCCGNSTLLWHESIFELHRYFYCIGPYFIYAPIQFCYLLNYLQDVFDARMASNDFYNVESLRVVEFLFIEILIPAVSLCDSNIFILNNFWRLFRWLDFKRRFKIYSLIDKYLYSSCEALMEVKYTSLVAIRGLLKRLSNDNIKEFSAMIVKLALTSPLIVFKEIFDQIQSYENIINPIVECLSSLIGYSYDILSYLFVAFIDRVKSDVKFESNIFLDPKIQIYIRAAATGPAVSKSIDFAA